MAVAGCQARHSQGNPNITHGPGPGAGTYSGRDPGINGGLGGEGFGHLPPVQSGDLLPPHLLAQMLEQVRQRCVSLLAAARASRAVGVFDHHTQLWQLAFEVGLFCARLLRR